MGTQRERERERERERSAYISWKEDTGALRASHTDRTPEADRREEKQGRRK